MDETRTYKPGDYPPTPGWAIPCKATGPDPSRAEMATAILCALYTGPYRNHVANHETATLAIEEAIGITDMFRDALEKPKP